MTHRCLCGCPAQDHQPLKQVWYILRARLTHWRWRHG